MNLREEYEKAIEKIGGSFKLSVLLQKRVRELVKGAQPLVEVKPDTNPIEIALREVLEDKIFLNNGSLEKFPKRKGLK
jgi:DNA-directed RNA polymerase subunit omega